MTRASTGPSATAERFSGRVADYEKARPGYPAAVREFLVERGALFPRAVVVDIGSGTGLFTELFFPGDFKVVAVEPNSEMRAAAERRFAGERGFRSVSGKAEATGLPDAAADLVVAAQAFHWFEPESTRAEWRRVLRAPKRAALVWNARRSTGSEFLERYERLLLDFGTDYTQVGHRGVGPDRLMAFFRAPFETFRTPNSQSLDRDGVRSRLLSSSYIPAAGTPRHGEMLAALDRLVEETAVDGLVELVYDCELHLGTLP